MNTTTNTTTTPRSVREEEYTFTSRAGLSTTRVHASGELSSGDFGYESPKKYSQFRDAKGNLHLVEGKIGFTRTIKKGKRVCPHNFPSPASCTECMGY